MKQIRYVASALIVLFLAFVLKEADKKDIMKAEDFLLTTKQDSLIEDAESTSELVEVPVNEEILEEIDVKKEEINDIRSIEQIVPKNNVTPTTGTGKTVLISAPFIAQSNTVYTNACEAVSTVMALQYAGVNITVNEFLNYLDVDPVNRHSFDPNQVYGGTPGTAGGMGCYAPVIMKALNRVLASSSLYGCNLTGSSLSTLCSEYLDNNIPVIFWGTMGMSRAYVVHYKEGLDWIAPEHCLLLIGYDDNYYYFNDSLKGANKRYSKSAVEAAYSALGRQAIVILQEKAPEPQAEPQAESQPQTKPEPQPEIASGSQPQTNPVTDLSVNTSSDIKVFTISANENVNFTVSYRSAQTASGIISPGWYHSFEKHAEKINDTVRIYDTPSVFHTYAPSDTENVYSCNETGNEQNVLTLTTDGGYVLEKNNGEKLFFETNGKLIAIEKASGYRVTLTYATNKIILTDSQDKTITLYLKDNLLSSVNSGSETIQFFYTGGRLTSLQMPDGNEFRYTYG